MRQISEDHGRHSPENEHEDVFFSQKLSEYFEPAPLSVAKMFSVETEFNDLAIGCHAPWKYLSSADLASLLDRHYRAVLSCLGYPTTVPDA